MGFKDVWNQILNHEGEEFETITGLKFSYRVEGNSVIPDRTEYPLHKSNYEKVFQMLPLKGLGEISDLVRGPSYVWAILNDKRIK